MRHLNPIFHKFLGLNAALQRGGFLVRNSGFGACIGSGFDAATVHKVLRYYLNLVILSFRNFSNYIKHGLCIFLMT